VALKPTIYKFNISLSDIDRGYYDSLHLTVAQHPSETHERMMTRIMAYCINADEHLAFTRGLSATEEPDLWIKTLDDQISLWIDVGEPSLDRIKKISRIAQSVKIYSFNSKSDLWWSRVSNDAHRLCVSAYQFKWETIQSLAAMVERTMTMSVTIADGSAFVATELGECEVNTVVLFQAD